MAHHSKQLPGRIARSIDRKKHQSLEPQKASLRQNVFSVIASAVVVLVIVLGFVFISTVARAGNTSVASSAATVSPGYGTLNHVKGWCGNNANQVACPAAGTSDWFSVSSETSAALTSAISGSNSFRSMMNRYGYQALDTPTLVHAMFAHTGISYYDDDHWVVSVRNAAGQRVGVFDFIYDRANHRMSFSAFGVVTPIDPHAQMAFPYTALSVASAALQKQRHLALMANSSAELVFIPIDPNFRNLNSPVHLWSGGGDSPMDPMWSLIGADGQEYFVGVDQNVYTQANLPLAQGTP